MAIIPRNAPNAITARAMAEAIAARTARAPHSALQTFDFGGGEAKLTASAPLPVYTIPIAALAEERPSSLDDATQQGWRVLTSDSQGGQLVDLSAATIKPLSVRRGRSVRLLAAAGELADQVANADAS